MLEWVDYSKLKAEWHSLSKQEIIYYRCKCACCKKCWYRPDLGICACGGPFTGFVKQEDTRG